MKKVYRKSFSVICVILICDKIIAETNNRKKRLKR